MGKSFRVIFQKLYLCRGEVGGGFQIWREHSVENTFTEDFGFKVFRTSVNFKPTAAVPKVGTVIAEIWLFKQQFSYLGVASRVSEVFQVD